MQRLDVLNQCLATTGASALTSVDDKHPLRASALAILARNNRITQARGWWFNRDTVTLTPDTSGKVILPGDALSVKTKTVLVANKRYVKRGSVLFNITDGTDIIETPITLDLVRLLDFEDLEELVADYVSACTVAEFQLDYDGDSDKMRKHEARRASAFVALNSEHTRQMQENRITSNPTVQLINQLTTGSRRYMP